MGQDFGRSDDQGDDLQGQSIDRLQKRPDEGSAAEADAVTDLGFDPVGRGDCFFPAGDDEGLVRADFFILLGEDEDGQGHENNDGAGDDESGHEIHKGLLLE